MAESDPSDDSKQPATTTRGHLRVASRAVKRGRKLRPSMLPGAPVDARAKAAPEHEDASLAQLASRAESDAAAEAHGDRERDDEREDENEGREHGGDENDEDEGRGENDERDDERDDENDEDESDDESDDENDEDESDGAHDDGAREAGRAKSSRELVRDSLGSAPQRSTQPTETGVATKSAAKVTIVTSQPGVLPDDPDLEYEEIELLRLSRFSRPSLPPMLFEAPKKASPVAVADARALPRTTARGEPDGTAAEEHTGSRDAQMPGALDISLDALHPKVAAPLFDESTLVSEKVRAEKRAAAAPKVAVVQARTSTSVPPRSASGALARGDRGADSGGAPTSAPSSAELPGSLRKTMAELERGQGGPPWALFVVAGIAIAGALALVRAVTKDDVPARGAAAVGPATPPLQATAATTAATHAASAAPTAAGDGTVGATTASSTPEASESAAASLSAAPEAASGEPVSEDYATVLEMTRKLLTERKFKEAEIWANKLIELRPKDAFGYRCLGAALQDLGRAAEAKRVYSDCVARATVGDVLECARLGGVPRR